MSASKKKSILSPKVVGTIHSEGSLRRALQIQAGEIDLLELRVDHFSDQPERLLKAIPKLAVPLIVTVRHPAEGGANALSLAKRKDLIRQFTGLANYLDVELRSTRALEREIADAHAQGLQIIVSDHHFKSTPSLEKLEERREAAKAAGADLFKIATRTNSLADVATLTALLASARSLRMSVMGMGPFGKVSRLLFARGGSALNYGYLDQSQVPGQWEATLLKIRVQELMEEA
jgi:3-dehydroquinate dehydratase-1